MKKEIISKISFTLRAGMIAGFAPFSSIPLGPLPYEAAEPHCLPLAKTGAGKSWVALLAQPSSPTPTRVSCLLLYAIYLSFKKVYISY